MSSRTQVGGGAGPRTLLYVEDNPVNLQLVEEIVVLRPQMRLLSAPDAILGIELARSSLPDVILMDMKLPGMSGGEALKILRQDPATAHIPVIAFSANALRHEIEKALAAGFFRYIAKPFRISEFLETVDVALEFAKTGANRGK